MRALVVDDSRAIRVILGRMLRDLDFEAEDGRSGLAQLEAGAEPDLILVDWHMPGMQGIDFVAAIRRAPLDFTGRIMMVTTETEAVQIARALDVGADEYVMKPFTQEVIAQKLELLGLGD